MFPRHESVLHVLFPPGLPQRSYVFFELFRSCRRKWRVLLKRTRWHIAWQFVIHVLWLWVEWPGHLPLEAGICLCGQRITLNMFSHKDHMRIIYGLKLWVMYYMLLHSRKLWMCCISKPFCAFLNNVYINWCEITFYERGLLRADFLSHDSCHINWLLPLLLFGRPCTRNLPGVSIDVKCSRIPSTSSSNVFETNGVFSPMGQCSFTSD
jgi:hypothetical protein